MSLHHLSSARLSVRCGTKLWNLSFPCPADATLTQQCSADAEYDSCHLTTMPSPHVTFLRAGAALTEPCDADVQRLCEGEAGRHRRGVFSIGAVGRCLAGQLGHGSALDGECRELVMAAAPLVCTNSLALMSAIVRWPAVPVLRSEHWVSCTFVLDVSNHPSGRPSGLTRICC